MRLTFALHIGNYWSVCCLLLLIITCVPAACVCAQNVSKNSSINGRLATSPPMGWNSWNWFGKKKINEKVVIEVVDAMVKTGLRDAGYNYIVVDGGWRDTKLDDDGMLIAHPKKFPRGIKFLADYAHSKGLKFGLHTVPGTQDCGGDIVGGFGREEIHLKQFIEWGVDFIKLDLCRFEGGWNEDLIKKTYYKWHDLITQSGAEIFLSISAYQYRDWGRDVGQMARTTEDISTIAGGMSGCVAVFDDTIPAEKNKWGLLSVMQIADENNKWAKFAGSGFWNDPDMLITGDQGLSDEEQRSHFSLWCIMSAPLMLGNDPRNMNETETSIVLSKECIRINQDSTEQGIRIKQHDSCEVWSKKLADGSRAVLLLNRNKRKSRSVRINFNEIGLKGNVKIRDVFSNKNVGTEREGYERKVKPASGIFLLFIPL